MVEPQIVVLDVAGSSPVDHPIFPLEMARVILLLIFCFALVLNGCSPRKLPSGGVITTAGRFAPLDQSWTLTVSKEGQYELEYPGSHMIWRQTDWNPKNGWFLAIEDARHLWAFDGDSHFYVYVWDDKGSMGRYDVRSASQVPKSIITALPADIRQKISSLGFSRE